MPDQSNCAEVSGDHRCSSACAEDPACPAIAAYDSDSREDVIRERLFTRWYSDERLCDLLVVEEDVEWLIAELERRAGTPRVIQSPGISVHIDHDLSPEEIETFCATLSTSLRRV